MFTKQTNTNVTKELRSDSTSGSNYSAASTQDGMESRVLNSATSPIESKARCDGPTFKVQSGVKIANIKGLLKIEQKKPQFSGSKKRAYEAVVEYADGSRELVPTDLLKKHAPEVS